MATLLDYAQLRLKAARNIFDTHKEDIGEFNACHGCLNCDTCRVLQVDSDEGNDVFDAAIEKMCLPAVRTFVDAQLGWHSPPAKKARLEDGNSSQGGEQYGEARLANLLQEPILEFGEDAVISSTCGRALKLTEAAMKLQQMCPSHEVKPLGGDAIMNLSERFIELHRMFESTGRDTNVTIGYHYTQPHNLKSICKHGLMSEAERAAGNIGHRKRIGWFGDGIYTGNNPHAFVEGYGTTGLIVAVLKGKSERILRRNDSVGDTMDSGVGNKNHSGSRKKNLDPCYEDEIILKQSSQVLPLASFSADWVKKSVNNIGPSDESRPGALWWYHVELQKIMDNFFNFGVRTKVEWVQVPFGGRGRMSVHAHMLRRQRDRLRRVHIASQGVVQSQPLPSIVNVSLAQQPRMVIPQPFQASVGVDRFTNYVPPSNVVPYPAASPPVLTRLNLNASNVHEVSQSQATLTVDLTSQRSQPTQFQASIWGDRSSHNVSTASRNMQYLGPQPVPQNDSNPMGLNLLTDTPRFNQAILNLREASSPGQSCQPPDLRIPNGIQVPALAFS